MGSSDRRAWEEKARADEGAARAAPCPICGSALIHLRGQARCARCSFTLCLGCEAPALPFEAPAVEAV
jgi:hypothetical protein